MKIVEQKDSFGTKLLSEYYRSLTLEETAHFNTLRQAYNHYIGDNAHVLKPGEEFDPDDPKYPETVSFEEYVKAAEELSDAKALPHSKLKLDGNVYGFVIKRKKDPTKRIVKIRTKSVFDPKYMDVIIYKDNWKDNQIFSFYMCRPDRYHRYDKDYVYELFSNGGPDRLYENYN